MLEELKIKVYEANMELPERNLVTYTWGNVSGFDRERGLMVIKPSGVPYNKLTADDMVVVDLDGNRVSGELNPSSDTLTHLELYRRFPHVGGIVHTHSHWATIFAQAGRAIPVYGTTHADYFFGDIPCTREMAYDEIAADYELNTGRVIAELFEANDLDPAEMPGALVKNHGPFTWGTTPVDALHTAVVLEKVAMMAYHTELLGCTEPMSVSLLDKHFLRKHGSGAYYGQLDRLDEQD